MNKRLALVPRRWLIAIASNGQKDPHFLQPPRWQRLYVLYFSQNNLQNHTVRELQVVRFPSLYPLGNVTRKRQQHSSTLTTNGRNVFTTGSRMHAMGERQDFRVEFAAVASQWQDGSLLPQCAVTRLPSSFPQAKPAAEKHRHCMEQLVSIKVTKRFSW